ncbi:hypothetical protein [uncultured Chryseobacterium sp.]|uniref:hypothetical protein n=1 Tax=uncultured Chryseobacterium sp. TaxID=259322 RepID=UPI0025E2A11F|nr:hypothetical protein [uncultured Chryseobacterium sp.]
MKKKFINWLFVNLLLPLIQDFATYTIKFFSKYFLDLLKKKMESWKETDENNTKTEEEKVIIRKKWKERMDDIEGIKTAMDQSTDKIIKNALQNSEEKFKKQILIENRDQKLI